MARDTRVFIQIPPYFQKIMDESPIFAPIKKLGNRVVFPYTPQITTSTSANYQPNQLTHTNYQYQAYNSSTPGPIQLSAQFVSQSVEEARYTFAVIHFFRSVTKMRFGTRDIFRGAPPPILYFSAYGDLLFKNVPVVVGTFTFSLEQTVDYIEIEFPATTGAAEDSYTQKVPVTTTMFADLIPQYLPGKTVREWSIQDFVNGNLMGRGFI
tara:strand:+ start:40 stop:669 length:630 start_codon:yes stop_codon:yes gene_type:complete